MADLHDLGSRVLGLLDESCCAAMHPDGRRTYALSAEDSWYFARGRSDESLLCARIHGGAAEVVLLKRTGERLGVWHALYGQTTGASATQHPSDFLVGLRGSVLSYDAATAERVVVGADRFLQRHYGSPKRELKGPLAG